MSEDKYSDYVTLMTDRSLSREERAAGLAAFKSGTSFTEYDRIRMRFFEGRA